MPTAEPTAASRWPLRATGTQASLGGRAGLLPQPTRRDAGFLLLLGLAAVASWQPLGALIRLSLGNDEYSHVVLMPLLAAFLVYVNRDAIFTDARGARAPGTLVGLIGIALGGLSRVTPLAEDARLRLALAILALVVFALGAFLFCYGTRALRAAAYPAAFLLLTVPLPAPALDRIVFFLQALSAEASDVLFGALGIPVLRDGYIFVLPGLIIEVAAECSGIRSSQALFITSLLAGHFLLRAVWTRTTLALAIIPLTVIKNAVRIVLLSWLAVYVDRGFITGTLHQYAGIPFFVGSLAVLCGVIWALRRLEVRSGTPQMRA